MKEFNNYQPITNSSWEGLFRFPYSIQVNYWENFLNTLDSNQVVKVDKIPRESLRHKTPNKFVEQKAMQIKQLSALNSKNVIPVIMGVDIPDDIRSMLPEARETSRYFILSQAGDSEIQTYYQIFSDMKKMVRTPNDQKVILEYVDFISDIMPQSRTKSFLSRGFQWQ